MKFKKIAVLLLVSMSYVTLSAAEVEFNGALSTDYIWRGMSQTGGEAALSGGLDVTSSKHGGYVGAWASGVDFESEANKEVDYYFGYTDESARGVSFDVGYISYNYPTEGELKFEEIYVGLAYKWLGVLIS
ncbi:MAG: TorF family putative porin, partial [Candidatus Thioglobus sp.]|nr:TorF family putative porin [Candidatus Thioglobus sp.]